MQDWYSFFRALKRAGCTGQVVEENLSELNFADLLLAMFGQCAPVRVRHIPFVIFGECYHILLENDSKLSVWVAVHTLSGFALLRLVNCRDALKFIIYPNICLIRVTSLHTSCYK